MKELEDLILLDDTTVTLDMYKQLLTKFYAVIRYQLYKLVQSYWAREGKAILTRKMMSVDLSNSETRLIDKEVIAGFVASIDYT